MDAAADHAADHAADRAVCLADFERLAGEVLPDGIRDWLNGGSGDFSRTTAA
jgi:hypothetical protein